MKSYNSTSSFESKKIDLSFFVGPLLIVSACFLLIAVLTGVTLYGVAEVLASTELSLIGFFGFILACILDGFSKYPTFAKY